MLRLFDLDRTLVPFDSTTLYPQAVELLKKFAANDDRIVIITNQGGPACHDAGWVDKYPTYRDTVDRLNEINWAIRDVMGYFPTTYASFVFQKSDGSYIVPDIFTRHREELETGNYDALPEMIDPRNRKPNPGYIYKAILEYMAIGGDSGIKMDVKVANDEILYSLSGLECCVSFHGDSEDDRKAAEAAGVKFIQVEWGK